MTTCSFLAAYQSLNGVDCAYWFSMEQPGWFTDPRRMFWKVGNSYALDKWSGNVPQVAGMFPACAIAFREGLIKQAQLIDTDVQGAVVPRAGHWLMEEAPGFVIPKIVEFLGRPGALTSE